MDRQLISAVRSSGTQAQTRGRLAEVLRCFSNSIVRALRSPLARSCGCSAKHAAIKRSRYALPRWPGPLPFKFIDSPLP
jgi:hypothetical protein